MVMGPFGVSSASTAKSLPAVSGVSGGDSGLGAGLSACVVELPAKRLALIVIISMQALRAVSDCSDFVRPARLETASLALRASINSLLRYSQAVCLSRWLMNASSASHLL